MAGNVNVHASLQTILSGLKGVTKHGDSFQACCPAHADDKASLSLEKSKTGKILLHCFAGCTADQILSTLGIPWSSLFQENGSRKKEGPPPKIIPEDTLNRLKTIPKEVLEYLHEVRGWCAQVIEKYRIGYHAQKQRITIPVRDFRGELVNIRLYLPQPQAGEEKFLPWKKGFGERRLYPIPVLREARDTNNVIYIAEGEPDVLCGLSHGLLCVTGTGGVGNWLDEWNPLFRGLHVRLVYDNDEAGRKGMQSICKHLPAFAAKVEVVSWPSFMGEKEDLTDWFVKHTKTKDDLEALTWVSSEQFTTANKDDPVLEQIEALNEKHAVVMLGGKCAVLNEVTDPIFNRPDITFSTPADFKNAYANQKVFIANAKGETKAVGIGHAWFEHPERKQFDQIIFSPGRDIPGCYNLYRGFAVQPKKGDWSLNRNHIHEIICSGNEQTDEYLINWMAHIPQKIVDGSYKKPEVAVVMKGGKGVGKGTFANDLYGGIFGSHFLQVTHPNQFLGRFNQHLKDCLILFADEAFWAGDKTSEGILKALITEETRWIEPKGKDAFQVKNYVSLIIASNNDWVVPAGLDERRFFVLEVSDARQQDHKYFKALRDEINNGGREAMLYDLLNMDLSGVNLRNVPQTQGLFEQKLMSGDSVTKFWISRLCEGSQLREDTAWTSFTETRKLYDEYVTYAKNLKHASVECDVVFSKKLRTLCPHGGMESPGIIGPSRINTGVGRKMCLVFPDLETCRKKFEQAARSPIQWPEEY